METEKGIGAVSAHPLNEMERLFHISSTGTPARLEERFATERGRPSALE
jgi:hypothetical protein